MFDMSKMALKKKYSMHDQNDHMHSHNGKFISCDCHTKENASWMDLARQFGSESTFHGLRKVLEKTNLVKRMIWLVAILAAMATLLFVSITQLIYLSGHPVVVNLQVIYNRSLVFPSVTICNQNLFRLSKAHKYGLYSQLQNTFSAQGVGKILHPDGFRISKDKALHYEQGVFYKYTHITPEVCQAVCKQLKSEACCSLIYIMESSTCYITAVERSVQGVQILSQPGVDLYEREVCSVKKQFITHFENAKLRVIIDGTNNPKWNHVQARDVGWPWIPTYDHTTLSKDGKFLMVSSRDTIDGKVLFYTPYISTTDDKACLQFFYILKSGTLSIAVGVDGSYKRIWKDRSLGLTTWEYARIALPKSFFRIRFRSSVNSSTSGMEVAVDDISVMSDCSDVPTGCKRSVTGIGYRGTLAINKNNVSCQGWSDPYTVWKDWVFPEEYETNLTDYYCRNPDGNPQGPWCVTNYLTGRMEYCDVPNCECNATGGNFMCQTGECISQRLRCDGVIDCQDGSDENQCQIYGVKANLTCEFARSSCGYETASVDGIKWIYNNGTGTKGYLSNVSYENGYVSTLFSPEFKPESIKSCLILNASALNLNGSEGNTLEIDLTLVNNTFFSHTLLVKTGTELTNAPLVYLTIDYVEFHDQFNSHSSFWNLQKYVYHLKLSNIENKPSDKIVLHHIMFHHMSCLEWLYKNFAEKEENDPNHSGDLDELYHSLELQPHIMHESTPEDESTPEENPFNHTLAYDMDLFSMNSSDVTTEVVTVSTEPSLEALFPELKTGYSTKPCRTCLRIPEFTENSLSNVNASNTDLCLSSVNCSFTTCPCGYKYSSSNVHLEWKMVVADEGYYVGLEQAAYEGDWTRIFSPMMNVEKESCLFLLYRTKYADIHVSTYNMTGFNKIFYITHDSQQDTWHMTKATLLPGAFGLTFQFNYMALSSDPIGIDNITIVEGSCLNHASDGNINCTFANYTLCGYMDVSQGAPFWFRSKEIGISDGAYFMRSRMTKRTKVPRQLLSPLIDITTEHCFHFQFYTKSSSMDQFSQFSVSKIYDGGEGIFTVVDRIRETGRNTSVIWWVKAVLNNNWHNGRITIPPGRLRLLFELNGDRFWGGIKLPHLIPGKCSDCLPERCNTIFQFACKSPTYLACIPNEYVDNGVSNCMDGVDEVNYRAGPAVPFIPPSSTANISYSHYVMDIESATANNQTSLQWLYDTLGHQRHDMIYSCNWRGENCTTNDFSKAVTDYGLCYTFNTQGNVNTSLTGASSGLSLTLNIEEYEYMRGPHLEAGIKMYLHNSTDIPEVRDLGFALPPGTHTLVGIRFSEASSIPYPWSECAATELQYFDTYTYSACKLDMATNYLNKSCQCRDAYMPNDTAGDPPLCSISEYMECVVPKTYYASDGGLNKGTGCPKPCYQSVYEQSLSFSRLSYLTMADILLKNTSQLVDSVQDAIHGQLRVFKDRFVSDMRGFQNLSLGYFNLIQQTLRYIGNAGCIEKPVFCQIAGAADTATQIFMMDVTNLFHASKERIAVFDTHIEQFVEFFLKDMGQLQYGLQELAASKYLNITIAVNTTDTFHLEANVRRHALAVALSLNIIYMVYNDTRGVNKVFDGILNETALDLLPKNLFKDESCKIFDEINDFLSQIHMQLAGAHTETIQGYVYQILNYKNSATICVTKYKLLLSEALDWMKQANDSLTTIITDIRNLVEKDITNSDNFKEINESYSVLQEVTSKYAFDAVKSQKLVDLLSLSGNIKTKVDLFRNNIQYNYNNIILELLQNLKKSLMKLYKEGLDLAVPLADYLGESFSYDHASLMEIWTAPEANLEKPKQYKRSDQEVWTIWSPTESIKYFTDTNASSYIKKGLESYFSPLTTQVVSFGDLMVQYVNELDDNLRILIDAQETYAKIQTIDQDFIKDNFLTVDIYYEELKYQNTAQVKSYTGVNFISDFGGFMGLLVGGSVLSLVELLDCCVNSVFIKSRERHAKKKRAKKKEITPSVTMNSYSSEDSKANPVYLDIELTIL